MNETFKIPGYEPFSNESTYVNLNDVEDVKIDEIKKRRIGKTALF